ncbi:hypothetical protein TRVL_01535 [Trypanosoma vivax]|nr:hypothetical protein TRVL_01535 [Trypanosoma vivax]
MPPWFFSLYASVLLLHLACSMTIATCPANGNTHVVYLTSNMGDNIWSFDTIGRYIGEVLNKESFPMRVEKLRDMRFGPGGYLYVASARGQLSRIFAVSGNGLLNGTLNKNCTRNYLFTVVEQNSANPLLDHPYSIAFHPEDDSLYISNQNSATITRYIRVKNATEKYPKWEPIENVKYAVTNVSTAMQIHKKAGLFASPWSSEYTMLSVRGLALSPPLPRSLVEQSAPPGWFATEKSLLTYYIVVCDVAFGQLHIFYADSGRYVFSIAVPSPVQVVFPSRYFGPISEPASFFEMPYVYVTSKEDGMTYLVPFVAPATASSVHEFNPTYPRRSTYSVTRPIPMHAASAVYENPSHDMLLVADRVGRFVQTLLTPFETNYEADKGPFPFRGYFVKNLPDMPEFILITQVEQQSAIPFCYELAAQGTFRYVPLCAAAYIWGVLVVMFLVIVVVVLVVRKLRRFVTLAWSGRMTTVQPFEMRNAENAPLISKQGARGYGTQS